MGDINKLDKLKELGLELNIKLPDIHIEKLYDFFNDLLSNVNINYEPNILGENNNNQVNELIKNDDNNKKNKVDESDPKYVVLLKFINRILANIGKPTITKLTEFINIDREDIIKKENFDIFDKMDYKIFKYFNKSKSGWYRRKHVKNYILTFIRYACNEIGYDFTYIHKNKQIKSLNKTHMFYSIK